MFSTAILQNVLSDLRKTGDTLFTDRSANAVTS